MCAVEEASNDNIKGQPPMHPLVRIEWLFCSMGGLWGRLESPVALCIWWAIRHLLYLGASLGLVLFVPTAVIPLSIFFFFAHIYKMFRFLVKSTYKERLKIQQKRAAAITSSTDKSRSEQDLEQGTMNQQAPNTDLKMDTAEGN